MPARLKRGRFENEVRVLKRENDQPAAMECIFPTQMLQIKSFPRWYKCWPLTDTALGVTKSRDLVYILFLFR